MDNSHRFRFFDTRAGTDYKFGIDCTRLWIPLRQNQVPTIRHGGLRDTFKHAPKTAVSVISKIAVHPSGRVARFFFYGANSKQLRQVDDQSSGLSCQAWVSRYFKPTSFQCAGPATARMRFALSAQTSNTTRRYKPPSAGRSFALHGFTRSRLQQQR